MPREWTIKEHIDAGHYPVAGEVKLRNGATAMIYTTDHPNSQYPIVGAFPEDGSMWRLVMWRVNGQTFLDRNPYDIAPPPPRKRKIEMWGVWAPGWDHAMSFSSESRARECAAADPARVAVLMTAEIEEPWPEPVDPTRIATTQFVEGPPVSHMDEESYEIGALIR